jgi:hypothetical protein
MLDLPSGASAGSDAQIIHRLGNDKTVIHSGQLLRLAGTLDPRTRQAQVTVAVDRPFDPVSDAVPLLPGTYVEVHLQGRALPQSFRIPRQALHEGNKVWVVVEDTIQPRTVTVSGQDGTSVLVSAGVAQGDHVVTSPLSLPVAGDAVEILVPDAPSGEE